MYYMCICENHIYTKLQVLVRLLPHEWANVFESSEKLPSKASEGIKFENAQSPGIPNLSKNKCTALLDAYDAFDAQQNYIRAAE